MKPKQILRTKQKQITTELNKSREEFEVKHQKEDDLFLRLKTVKLARELSEVRFKRMAILLQKAKKQKNKERIKQLQKEMDKADADYKISDDRIEFLKKELQKMIKGKNK